MKDERIDGDETGNEVQKNEEYTAAYETIAQIRKLGNEQEMDKINGEKDVQAKKNQTLPQKEGDPGYSDESSEGSSDEERERKIRKKVEAKEQNDPEKILLEKGEPRISQLNHQRSEERSLGLNGIMNAFVGRQVFYGGYEEDLDSIMNVFDTLS